MDNVFILPENAAFPAACLVFEQEAPSRLYFSHGKKNAHCEKRRNLLYCEGKFFRSDLCFCRACAAAHGSRKEPTPYALFHPESHYAVVYEAG